MCLMAFVVGCTTTQTVTERVAVTPPMSLYPDCATPEHTIHTNGDLARGYREMREALRLCREGVEALADWGRDVNPDS